MGEDFDELAVTLNEQGEGDWELRLEDGETMTVRLNEVDVSEQRGFHAEGRDEGGERLVELTTGDQPGGPIRVRERPLDGEEWETAGELADAHVVG